MWSFDKSRDNIYSLQDESQLAVTSKDKKLLIIDHVINVEDDNSVQVINALI